MGQHSSDRAIMAAATLYTIPPILVFCWCSAGWPWRAGRRAAQKGRTPCTATACCTRLADAVLVPPFAGRPPRPGRCWPWKTDWPAYAVRPQRRRAEQLSALTAACAPRRRNRSSRSMRKAAMSARLAHRDRQPLPGQRRPRCGRRRAAHPGGVPGARGRPGRRRHQRGPGAVGGREHRRGQSGHRHPRVRGPPRPGDHGTRPRRCTAFSRPGWPRAPSTSPVMAAPATTPITCSPPSRAASPGCASATCRRSPRPSPPGSPRSCRGTCGWPGSPRAFPPPSRPPRWTGCSAASSASPG